MNRNKIALDSAITVVNQMNLESGMSETVGVDLMDEMSRSEDGVFTVESFTGEPALGDNGALVSKTMSNLFPILQSGTDTQESGFSTESFQDLKMKETLALTLAYISANTNRASEYAEAFLDTNLVPYGVRNTEVTLPVTYVRGNSLITGISHTSNDFLDVPVQKNLPQGKLTTLNGSELIPIVNATTTPFLQVALVKDVNVDGVITPTAPILFSAEPSSLTVMGMSGALLAKGAINDTDGIAQAGKVGALYVKIGVQYVRVDVSGDGNNTFTRQLVGDSATMEVNNTTGALLIFSELDTTHNGAEITNLTALGGYTFAVRAKYSITIDNETGSCSHTVNGIILDNVYDAGGVVVTATDAKYTTVAAIVDTMELTSFSLSGVRLTNANNRNTGIKITAKEKRVQYTNESQTPISMEYTTGASGVATLYKSEKLLALSNIETSSRELMVVMAIRDRWESIKRYARVDLVDPTFSAGIGAAFTHVTYVESSVDLSNISSLENTGKDANVSATMITSLKYVVTGMLGKGYEQSFKAAGGTRIVVSLGTTSDIAPWLGQVTAEDLGLDESIYSVVLVTTSIPEHGDVIRVGFKAEGTDAMLGFKTGKLSYSATPVIEYNKLSGTEVGGATIRPITSIILSGVVAGMVTITNIATVTARSGILTSA